MIGHSSTPLAPVTLSSGSHCASLSWLRFIAIVLSGFCWLKKEDAARKKRFRNFLLGPFWHSRYALLIYWTRKQVLALPLHGSLIAWVPQQHDAPENLCNSTVSDFCLLTHHAGTGTAWLFPLVDGAPPVGWEDAARYLALPIALVAAQFASSAVISPPIDDEDKNANFSKALLVLVPFMVGWFALNVPSGLSLYYFSNTIITSSIQIWLRKLGGAYSNLLIS